MAERKKVIATLVTWDNKNNNGWLSAEDTTPDIFLNKATLQQKKCTNLNPKVGDVFEAEIELGTRNKKPSWNIITIKAMEKELKLQNFALQLHKTKLFGYNRKEEKGKEKKIRYEFELKKLKNQDFDYAAIFGSHSEKQVQEYYAAICQRDKELAKQLTGGQITVQQFKPEPHLIIGLGGGSVYETAITLHHVYGFPYLPASSLKGALRSYLITRYFDQNEGKAFENKVMCDIFGCPKEIREEKDKKNYTTYYEEERQGKMIFFDAMPTESPENSIELDIMNPHYPKYYGENKAPDDFQNPIPVFFLRVTNLSFQVIVGLRKGATNETIADFAGKQGKDLLTLTAELLTEALENFGIGAKTALGYGYMKKVQ